MSTTMKVILDQSTLKLKYRNTNFDELQTLFGITHSLMLEHEAEILNVSAMVTDIDELGNFGRVRNSCSKTQCKRLTYAEKWSKLLILDS